MAVLKSPRNNKKKKKWALQYVVKTPKKDSTTLRWIDYKKEHILHKHFSMLDTNQVTLESIETDSLPYHETPLSRKNPFVRPNFQLKLPFNRHFRIQKNPNRIFQPLIFSTVI